MRIKNDYIIPKNIEMLNATHVKVETHYHFGNYTILDKRWDLQNAICPNTKLFYITKGEIEIVIDGNSIVASAGDMMLIPSGTIHDYHLTKTQYAEKFWTNFDISINNQNIFESYSIPYKITIGDNAEIYEKFQQLVATPNIPIHLLSLKRSALLCELCSFYLEHCDLAVKINNNPLWDLIEYLNENYMEKFTVEQLAQKSFLSKNQFLRRFKALMGVSPIHYINSLRLNKAKKMLEETNTPISQIMEAIGFYDSAYFSKTFKEYYGCSPKEYRDGSKSKTTH